MRWTVAVLVLTAACHQHHRDNRPLGEAILGSWNIICSTTDERTSVCPGNDGRSTYYEFHAGGVVELGGGATNAAPDRGRWTLDGNALDVRFDEGAGVEVDHYRARIDGDQLALWDWPRGFGTILARKGTAVETEPLAVSTGGTTKGDLAGTHYTIDLPSGYQLTRNDGAEQRWSPPGDGFVVELEGVTTGDCHGSVTGSRRDIDGVEHETSVGINTCVDRSDYLACSVRHTRGYLEPDEHDRALALCRHVSVDAR